MAPIRRYLRITKHSVLEVRIYLDRPSDADSWLLKRENPALPRVIQAIRPLVLPKLREEYERVKGRAGAKARKKGVKDVVVEDDFEVSIFLTDHSSRHSVLTKQKIFKDKPRIQSNSGKLTTWLTAGTSEKPLVIDQDSTEPILVREEEDDDEVINLADIPEVGSQQDEQFRHTTRNKRRSGDANEELASDESLDESVQTTKWRSRNASNRDADPDSDDEPGLQDDKKKFGINTSYDGFSIYGRILCLVVKRRGGRSQAGGGDSGGVPISSQQMLEHWVSTQAAAEQVDDDEDNG